MTSQPGPESPKSLSRGLPPGEPRTWLTVLLVVQVALVVNGRDTLGSQWPTDTAMSYLVFGLIPLIASDALKRELLQGTLREYALKFVFGFLVTVLLFWGLWMEGLGLPVGRIGYSAVWPMIVLQAMFVAPVEELFFRGWLTRVADPKGTTYRLYAAVTLGGVFAAVMFSGFHFAAFGAQSWTPYVVTFVLALVWTVASRWELGFPFHLNAKKPMGIPFTIGSHLAWNMCVMGILTGGVLVGT